MWNKVDRVESQGAVCFVGDPVAGALLAMSCAAVLQALPAYSSAWVSDTCVSFDSLLSMLALSCQQSPAFICESAVHVLHGPRQCSLCALCILSAFHLCAHWVSDDATDSAKGRRICLLTLKGFWVPGLSLG
jgi:hypothetical protein